MRTQLRRYFVAGLLVFLPLAVTFTVLAWLFQFLDNFLGRLITYIFGRPIPGAGLVATVAVIFLIGALVTNVLGRRMVRAMDSILMRIPLARSIYSATKQISDSIFIRRKGAFQRVVLLQWPRKGTYIIGFVTADGGAEKWIGSPRRFLNVFMVTTPNPTSGFLMFVPEEETIPLPISVEDALKLVLSGGIVGPMEPLPPAAVPQVTVPAGTETAGSPDLNEASS
ncbi:MAG TPA: DUF502 domain-containing protein [bacterium]|jgi:uncharacterized membrane protein